MTDRTWRTDVAAQDPDPQRAEAVAEARRLIEAHLAEQRAARAEREASTARLRALCGVAPPPPSHWTWGDRLRGGRKRPLTLRERLTGGDDGR